MADVFLGEPGAGSGTNYLDGKLSLMAELVMTRDTNKQRSAGNPLHRTDSGLPQNVVEKMQAVTLSPTWKTPSQN